MEAFPRILLRCTSTKLSHALSQLYLRIEFSELVLPNCLSAKFELIIFNPVSSVQSRPTAFLIRNALLELDKACRSLAHPDSQHSRHCEKQRRGPVLRGRKDAGLGLGSTFISPHPAQKRANYASAASDWAEQSSITVRRGASVWLRRPDYWSFEYREFLVLRLRQLSQLARSQQQHELLDGVLEK